MTLILNFKNKQMKKMKLEMYYTLTCPNCKTLERMLDDILPAYSEKIEFKKVMANSPSGYLKTLKLGIHSVPTLVLNGKIIFRYVPEKQILVEKIISEINKN
jgi:predicted DsbA family dithiol-disulfide isomerase